MIVAAAVANKGLQATTHRFCDAAHRVLCHKFLGDFDNSVCASNDIVLGCEATEPDPDRRLCAARVGTESLQDMRRRESARRAGRPRRDGNVAERQHECVGLNAGKADIQVSGQTLIEATVDRQLGYRVT